MNSTIPDKFMHDTERQTGSSCFFVLRLISMQPWMALDAQSSCLSLSVMTVCVGHNTQIRPRDYKVKSLIRGSIHWIVNIILKLRL